MLCVRLSRHLLHTSQVRIWVTIPNSRQGLLTAVTVGFRCLSTLGSSLALLVLRAFAR